jgi:serine/threonine protein kinase
VHVGAGTLPYMAPELLIAGQVGASAIQPGNRVDIYAFAMIMWEMLARRVPWGHMNPTSLMAAVRAVVHQHRCLIEVPSEL